MELTKLEKDVLSIIEGMRFDTAVLFVKEKLSISEEKSLEIIDKLISLNLIDKVTIPELNKSKRELLFRTNKVDLDMLNDDLRYESEVGSEKIKDGPISRLRKLNNHPH